MPHRAARPIAVLIVDDHPTVRALAQRMLGRAHVRTLEACFDDALSVLAAHGAELDVLLVELRPDDPRGIALVSMLTREFPHIRMIYMSAGLFTVGEFAVVAASGTPLLHKPFTPDELARVVGSAVGRSVELDA